MLDRHWSIAARASGGLNGERTMLFLALMLADELDGSHRRPPEGAGAAMLEQVARAFEKLTATLEKMPPEGLGSRRRALPGTSTYRLSLRRLFFLGVVPALALACRTRSPPDANGVRGYSGKRPRRSRHLLFRDGYATRSSPRLVRGPPCRIHRRVCGTVDAGTRPALRQRRGAAADSPTGRNPPCARIRADHDQFFAGGPPAIAPYPAFDRLERWPSNT